MEWKNINKQKLYFILGALVFFVAIAAGAFTLGKYVLNRNQSGPRVVVAVSDYERVYGDTAAPYEEPDGFGNYYVHYIGEKSGESRTYLDMTNDLDANGFIGTTKTKLTTTYKLFEGNQTLERVLMPSKINSEVIQTNTFQNAKNAKPSSEIQLIYGDEGSTDISDRVFTDAHVTPYVNMIGYGQNSYDGFKNIFVSSSMETIDELFMGNYSVEKVLFDEKGTWTDLQRAFYGCKTITSLDNIIFSPNMYKTITNMENTFSGTGIKEIPSTFQFPENVTTIQSIFGNCEDLESIPADFKVPASVTDAREIFYGCSSLATAPNTMFDNAVSLTDLNEAFKYSGIEEAIFKFPVSKNLMNLSGMFEYCDSLKLIDMTLPEGIRNISNMFRDCKQARGKLEIPSSITSMDTTFESAGTDTDEAYEGYGTPLVMTYYYSDTVKREIEYANAFNNLHTEKYPDGRVTPVELKFSKVYEEDAPYVNEEGENYYLHYVASYDTLDLEEEMKNQMVTYGTEITNTYKMFDSASQIKRVVVPESIPTSKIESNTFINTSQNIQLIFKDVKNDISDKQFEQAGDVVPYAYLSDDNQGDVMNCKHIFISYEYSTLSNGTLCDSNLTKAYIDETGYEKNGEEWVNFDNAFAYCVSITSLDDIIIPAEISEHITSMNFTFAGTGITSIPASFSLPENVTSLDSLFTDCQELEIIEEGFRIPSNVTSVNYMFANTSLKNIPANLFIESNEILFMYNTFSMTKIEKINKDFHFPEKVEEINGLFEGCEELTTIEDGFVIPASVKICSSVFKDTTKLTNVPMNIFEHADNVETLSYVFNGSSLTTATFVLPESGNLTDVGDMLSYSNVKTIDMKIPDSVDNMNYFLEESHYAVGKVRMPAALISMYYAFSNVGASTSECYEDYATPIIMEYDIENKTIQNVLKEPDSYNIYNSMSNENGKVTACNSKFKKVYETGAPYDGGKGAYYIHYIGDETDLDLEKHLTPDKKLLGQDITSTYKMFEGVQTIRQLLIPKEISADSIEATIFDNTSQAVNLIFKDYESSSDPADITFTNENITPYVYITQNNMSRVNGYKNVYISREKRMTDEFFELDKTTVETLLFDEEGPDTDGNNWTSFEDAFSDLKNLKSPENAIIPDKVREQIVNASYLFTRSGIEKIPASYRFPENATTVLSSFSQCEKLTTIEEGFQLSENITDAGSLFLGCISLETIPTDLFGNPKGELGARYFFSGCSSLKNINLIIPEGVTDIEAMFAECSSLSGTVSLPSTITEMRGIFRLAGSEATTNQPGYDTPIVMFYDPDNSVIQEALKDPVEYNFYDAIKNPDGKVTPVPKTAATSTNLLNAKINASKQLVESSVHVQVKVTDPEDTAQKQPVSNTKEDQTLPKESDVEIKKDIEEDDENKQRDTAADNTIDQIVPVDKENNTVSQQLTTKE